MKTIKLEKLRNDEFIQFLNGVITMVNANPVVRPQLEDYLTPLTAQVLKLKKNFNVRGSTYTTQIRNADRKRGEAFKGLKYLIKSYLNHSDPQLVDYATQVMFEIDKYGVNLYNLNYQSETEHIRMLINALNRLQASDHSIEALNLSVWVKDLNTYNEEFDALYLARVSSYAEPGNVPVSKSRRETGHCFVKMLYLLDAYIEIKRVTQHTEQSDFEEVRNSIDVLTQEYNDMIALRKAQASLHEKPEEDMPSIDHSTEE